MKIKYNRTSTLQQKGERFKLDETKYDETINDFGVSGKIEFKDREGGSRLMNTVEKGLVSEIIFEDVSRVGRTLKDSINTLDYFTNEKGILVTIRNIGITSHTPDKKPNPMWKLITSILCSVYDMERERILELTRHGRQAYILNGGKMGRPKNSKMSNKEFLNREQSKNILRLIRLGKSRRDITSRLKCSPNTVSKIKKLLKTDEFNHLLSDTQKPTKSQKPLSTKKVSFNPPTVKKEISSNPPSKKKEVSSNPPSKKYDKYLKEDGSIDWDVSKEYGNY